MSEWQKILAVFLVGLMAVVFWAPGKSDPRPASYTIPTRTEYVVTTAPPKPKRKPRSDKGKRRPKVGPREKDIAGNRYGLLVAVRRQGTNKHGHPMWKFACDCGNTVVSLKANVCRTVNPTVSCGCWKKEVMSERMRKKAAAAKEMH